MTRYAFETEGSRRSSAGPEFTAFRKKFIERVLKTEALSDSIDEFVCAFHLRIAYYKRKRKQTFRMRLVWYVVLAVGFCGIIAVLWGRRAGGTSLEATVALGAIFGVFRILGEQVKRRSVSHLFWEAEAGLKAILYRFEDSWRGKCFDKDGKLVVGFDAALRAATREADAVESKERTGFFRQMDSVLPTLGALRSGLADARAVVRSSAKKGYPTNFEELARIEKGLKAELAKAAALDADDPSRTMLIQKLRLELGRATVSRIMAGA